MTDRRRGSERVSEQGIGIFPGIATNVLRWLWLCAYTCTRHRPFSVYMPGIITIALMIREGPDKVWSVHLKCKNELHANVIETEAAASYPCYIGNIQSTA